MIRIITKRGDNGVQEEWTDYPDREIGEVPASLALRFDAELVALKLADLDLGVKRWTEAAFRARRFSARATTKIAELLGEVVTDSTKKNLEMRVEAENGATAGKTDLAKRAKAAGLDAIHDTVHEMARDEARHGKAFAGLLKRYFG